MNEKTIPIPGQVKALVSDNSLVFVTGETSNGKLIVRIRDTGEIKRVEKTEVKHVEG